MESRERNIDDGERSGVLVPANLARFDAQWVAAAGTVGDVVDTYWSVRWRLAPHEAVAQKIVDFPAITLSIESGDVPAPFLITAVLALAVGAGLGMYAPGAHSLGEAVKYSKTAPARSE